MGANNDSLRRALIGLIGSLCVLFASGDTAGIVLGLLIAILQHQNTELFQSQIEEANSLSEQCGIMRLVEVLGSVTWDLKKDNFKKITGKEGLDRLLAIVEGLSESSDDSDLEPDDKDTEAIWKAFSSCGLSPYNSEATTSSSISNEKECEASVTITIDNKKKSSSNAAFQKASKNHGVDLYKGLKETREANMTQTDPAKRADNAIAYLSKFLDLKDLKLNDDEETARQKKTD